MGQYIYVPDPGEQRGGFQTAVPDQLAQLRQRQMQQQMQQPVPVPMQPQTVSAPVVPQNSGIIWVGSKQEADGWAISPHSAIALWDRNAPSDAPIIYLRLTDSTGKPITKVYDLMERLEGQQVPPQPPQVDLSRFITREELENILAERLKRPSKPVKPKEDTENG